MLSRLDTSSLIASRFSERVCASSQHGSANVTFRALRDTHLEHLQALRYRRHRRFRAGDRTCVKGLFGYAQYRTNARDGHDRLFGPLRALHRQRDCGGGGAWPGGCRSDGRRLMNALRERDVS
jgi:hypothetical protein